MTSTPSKSRVPLAAALTETFGFSPLIASCLAVALLAILASAVVWLVLSAPPRRLTITSGPAGSSFQRYAERYKEQLAKHGVTLEIRPSGGSLDNLQRLAAADSGVDIGFVQGGLTQGKAPAGLRSLGSVAYQPLWVFYRGEARITRLSALAGKRIGVDASGSGTHALALALLQANGITGKSTVLVDEAAEMAATDLLAGKLDAVFLMGDSAPLQILRTLIRAPGVQLFNFVQADAYTRRYAYLNKIILPEGSIDLGTDLPAQDVALVGPTVELIARAGLNSAISDLLLGTAQEVHAKAGLLQKQGEFPAPIAQEFPLSDDAVRFYKSGKGWLYQTISSFWLASLLNRLLVVIVPLILVLVPTLRFLPVVYRWRILLRIYRCYRPLLRLERESQAVLTDEQRGALLNRLDDIEHTVDGLKVPASFANQFYDLHHHIAFVRARLKGVAWLGAGQTGRGPGRVT
ncbi:ABC transporter substrate-binding protein [Horticoccus luteus]|uniref:ABC transporter substrate-binding protein n=1 Tax=Horticoccus luteus TaxID=2862869 RepID=A0A8F9TWA4_9BACT|nr:TAXI family TRAP transporter solute-binding subunit [Horticoccus luteus]QYM78737.1 ABC transporter substrate-binding protein [Horticoccus luteus]